MEPTRAESLWSSKPLWLVTEIDLKDGCKHLRYFLVPVTSYREGISESGFFGYKNNYHKTDKILYHRAWIHDIHLIYQASIELKQEPKHIAYNKEKVDLCNGIGSIKCDSFYDFYNKIGFNRKTKKYDHQLSTSPAA